MKKPNTEESNSINEYFKKHFDLPTGLAFLYGRFWQLETWLRQMVYLEIRSYLTDWQNYLPKRKNDPFTKDKSLTHMLTPQENILSYLTFGELLEIIKRDLWNCFSCYFPPRDIFEARLKELTQIRHRIAHFREPHVDDLKRVEQFLRDIDQNFWTFCTSYNRTYRFQGDNPLAERLSNIDTSIVDLGIDYTIRPWVDKNAIKAPLVPQPGIVYVISIIALEMRKFEFDKILNLTKKFHNQCIHIKLDHLCTSFEITYPSVLPLENIADSIQNFHEMARYHVFPKYAADEEAERIASHWPEYVLSPSDPLAFLCPDMPCSFFGV